MKKFLTLTLLLMSVAAFAPSAQASSNVGGTTIHNSAAKAAAAQYRVQYGQNRRNNRRAVRIYTRNVRVGRQIFRETYRVTYRANGATRTRLVSRVRIGRY